MTQRLQIMLLGENDFPEHTPIRVDAPEGLAALVATVRERHPAGDAEAIVIRALLRSGVPFLRKALNGLDLSEEGLLVQRKQKGKPATETLRESPRQAARRLQGRA